MASGLLEVGELPKRSRSTGRRPGKWRGHDQLAVELRTWASREPDPTKRWGKVAGRVSMYKAQAIAQAIKKGEAIGFERTAKGRFEASTYKSKDQSRPPKDKNGNPQVLYDVWARWVPTART